MQHTGKQRRTRKCYYFQIMTEKWTWFYLFLKSADPSPDPAAQTQTRGLILVLVYPIKEFTEYHFGSKSPGLILNFRAMSYHLIWNNTNNYFYYSVRLRSWVSLPTVHIYTEEISFVVVIFNNNIHESIWFQITEFCIAIATKKIDYFYTLE